MDVREIPPLFIRVSLEGQTSHMGTIIRTMEDHLINAQISNLTETVEIDPELDLSTIRKGTGETVAIFPVLHQIKGETSHKMNYIANQEVINLTIPVSADLRVDIRLVLHQANKSFQKIIRHHLMWFTSPQPTIRIINYQIFAR